MKKLALAVLIGTAILPSLALAQDKEVQLKISLWVPPAHPLVPSTKDWAADIEKGSGGTIKTTVVPSSSARRSTITTWRATASPT